jgi:hypothetical protein
MRVADTIEPASTMAAKTRQPHRHHGHRHAHAFHHALARTHARTAAPRSEVAAGLPGAVEDAIRKAMTREGAPASWTDSLRFLVAKESGGQVDVRNPHHSARGLFQLTASNYALNPHGAASFGDAVEEAQGGIRYVRARYGTAEVAAAFWRRKGWF